MYSRQDQGTDLGQQRDPLAECLIELGFEPAAHLGGDFRQMTENQRGELDWNYLPYDSQYGASRSRVQLTELADLPYDWRLNVSAANVSDRRYFEDFSNGPEGASTAFLERRGTLSYRSEHWNVVAEAQQYQTIDYTLAEPDRPYARAPHLWQSFPCDGRRQR